MAVSDVLQLLAAILSTILRLERFPFCVQMNASKIELSIILSGFHFRIFQRVFDSSSTSIVNIYIRFFLFVELLFRIVFVSFFLFDFY